jgi:hypothetical protein
MDLEKNNNQNYLLNGTGSFSFNNSSLNNNPNGKESV